MSPRTHLKFKRVVATVGEHVGDRVSSNERQGLSSRDVGEDVAATAREG